VTDAPQVPADREGQHEQPNDHNGKLLLNTLGDQREIPRITRVQEWQNPMLKVDSQPVRSQ
jgi:hypothetical protein